MDRQCREGRERRVDRLAAVARHPHRGSVERLRRSGAEGEEGEWPDNVELGLEPGLAGLDLARTRGLVQAALAAGPPLEVLDRVGQVDLAAVDLGTLQRLREDPSRRADEGLALDVLAIARLLADQHQPCLARALAEDRLRGVFP